MVLSATDINKSLGLYFKIDGVYLMWLWRNFPQIYFPVLGEDRRMKSGFKKYKPVKMFLMFTNA